MNEPGVKDTGFHEKSNGNTNHVGIKTKTQKTSGTDCTEEWGEKVVLLDW